MKLSRASLLILMVFAVALTGCAKKVTDESQNVGTTDSLTPTEDLSQLPPANANAAAPAAVEPLPVEAAPVTQAAAPVAAGVSVANEAKSAAKADASVPTEQNRKVQQLLKNAGFYSGKVDGKIGPASKKAIEAFQKSSGLKPDGKVGPKTLAALEKHAAASASAVSDAVPASAPAANQ